MYIGIPIFDIFHAQGRTPLRIALLEGSLDIAGLLLDNAADIDYVDTDCRFNSRFHPISYFPMKKREDN